MNGDVPAGWSITTRESTSDISLTWPGRGRVVVSITEGVCVYAANEEQCRELSDLCASWSRAAWWRLSGIDSGLGTIVQSRTHTIVLRASYRQGKSSIALGLADLGWSLLADGTYCQLGGLAQPVDSIVELDQAWAEHMFPHRASTCVNLGRRRRRLPMAQGVAAPISAIVGVRMRQGLAGYQVAWDERMPDGDTPHLKVIIPVTPGGSPEGLVAPSTIARDLHRLLAGVPA